MNEFTKIVIALVTIAVTCVPVLGRGEETMSHADILKDKTLLGQTQCIVKKTPPYLVPCVEYEDENYRYYSLARESGEVLVINRVSKNDPQNVMVVWVADSLKEALKYYERTHSY